MPFTVFIPGFLSRFESAQRPRLPNLERLLARAGQREPESDPAEFLAPLFGYQAAELAPAPFMHLADTGQGDSHYRLCADPVHLAADRDQLVLVPDSILRVSREEALALTRAFNDLHGADGWRLENTAPGRGYLRAPRPLQVDTTEPGRIVGRSVLEFMPSGSDAMPIRRLMNETQMLFHEHAVNLRREEHGRPTVNSLWLWGGGSLPAHPGRAPQQIVTDLPFVKGLALHAGVTPQAPKLDINDVHWERRTLIALDATNLPMLEEEWLEPVFTSLKRGRLDMLTLLLGGLGIFTLTSRDARRFWRRARPIGAPC